VRTQSVLPLLLHIRFPLHHSIMRHYTKKINNDNDGQSSNQSLLQAAELQEGGIHMEEMIFFQRPLLWYRVTQDKTPHCMQQISFLSVKTGVYIYLLLCPCSFIPPPLSLLLLPLLRPPPPPPSTPSSKTEVCPKCPCATPPVASPPLHSSFSSPPPPPQTRPGGSHPPPSTPSLPPSLPPSSSRVVALALGSPE